MNKNTKKYIVKTTAASLAISFLACYAPHMQTRYPYTKEDIKTNAAIVREIESIGSETIEFKNEELYKLLLEQNNVTEINRSNIGEIRGLHIDHKLENEDLSDLRYLNGLTSFSSQGMDVDASDLQYCYALQMILLSEGKLSHTELLPNEIDDITLFDVDITDDIFKVPYFTTSIGLHRSTIPTITFKNPEILNKFSMEGDNILDLEAFVNCSNLKYLVLTQCSNIRNQEVLKDLDLDTLELDDYCPIWVTEDTLNNVSIPDPERTYYLDEVRAIDAMYEEIFKDTENLSNRDKFNKILLYVVDRLEYDERTIDNEDKTIVVKLNEAPIKAAIDKIPTVCISYGCLMEALCNRAGLDTVQMFSEVHTWLAYRDDATKEYKHYDPTNLDLGSIVEGIDVRTNEKVRFIDENETIEEKILDGRGNELYFYNFNTEDSVLDSYENSYDLEPNVDSDKNIGYITEFQTLRTLTENIEHEGAVLNTVIMAVMLEMLALGVYALKHRKDLDYCLRLFDYEEKEEPYEPKTLSK